MRSIRLPSDSKEIGPFLRDLRKRFGLKQLDVVAATGKGQGPISALENGHTAPLLPTVIAYLDALGCTIDISRLDGEDIPEVRVPIRREVGYASRPYKYRARKKPQTDPPARQKSPGITSTGRCLGCFTNHPKGEVFCP